MIIETTFYILSGFLIIISLLPFINNKHWLFRIWDFGKIQTTVSLIIVTLIGLFLDKNIYLNIVIAINIIFIFYHSWILLEFTPFYYWFHKKHKIKGKLTDSVSILSSNVYQFNDSTHKLVDLIEKRNPDIFITYESDQKWENALLSHERNYPFSVNIAQDNTYGMHLFSKYPFKYQKVHYFVSDDIPCIEIEISIQNQKLRLFAVHPPPPSPTEESTSKERDGELMAIAKYIKNFKDDNILVVGDFNNVAWAKSSKRFRRISNLNDPRVGRGLIPTFHAKYPLLRIPIDLLFHSTTLLIDKIETTETIDSDHYPLYFTFKISTEKEENVQENEEEGDEEQMNRDIQEGKEEKGDRD